jgi:ATP-dependent Clp protease ATP-binding subunit ClpC
MSELAESHGVAKLVGAPPGYLGYGEGGQLTEPVRRRPSCVVLLDEVEKAHRDVLLLLLQVLDEGRLTDSRGRHIDFSNTVVVLTTNLGAQAFAKSGAPMGFGAGGGAVATDRAMDLARAAVPPELWNRIDERLVFAPLDRPEIARIAQLLVEQSSTRLFSEKHIRYAVDEQVIGHLIEHGGFDASLGARPMRQTVQRLIEAPLAEEILAGRFGRGDSIRVGIADEKISFARA